ncbi:MAG: SDR family oxidoreductase [Candidatus Coproplasma sp.]
MGRKTGTGKVALVTGGSSGIGKAVCERLAGEGYTVYELSRRDRESQPGIKHISCDITDESAVKRSVEQVIAQSGKIDLLVNNAGFGISGAVEFTDVEEAKRLFDVNFFGNVITTSAVVPYMRKAGCGRIINISSVAGDLSIPYQSFYSAGKAAINALTLALRNELKAFNIQVCALMPGDVHTGFTDVRQKSVKGDDVYKGAIERAVSVMEHDELNGMKPQTLAAKVFKLAKKRRVKPFYTCGVKYGFFLFLAKILPRSLSNFIVGKIYG